MSQLFASMFPDSKIAANMQIRRTKASYVLQDGIAHAEKESLSDMLADSNFSLMIDESTDISVTQVLAIVIRFLQNNSVKDALLDIVEVEDGSSETLYSTVKNILEKKKIPLQNIVGFAADNCATMMGKHSGFQALMKRDLPNVFVLGCVCHSFALCASHASEKLPSWLETFVKDICSYFSRSSKRQRDFDLIQKAIKAEDHKMLKLSQTRWLSRGQVIARIIEQWDALHLFFQSQAPVDKTDGAANIFKVMDTPGTKHMLFFLSYLLPKIDKLNLHFQSEEPQIHTLFNNISSLFRELLSMFVRHDILATRDLSDIDPSDTSIHCSINKVILGGRCTAELLITPLRQNEERFRQDCLRFLVELCKQIRRRFEFSNASVLSSLCVLDPHVALSPARSVHSLSALALQFPHIVPHKDIDMLDDEWNALLHCKEQLGHLLQTSIPEFWSMVKSLKDGVGDFKFPTVGRLMCSLAVLPHSSACVERIFSEVNMIKTPLTNKLHSTTLANRILARQYLGRRNSTCCTWSPDQKLVESVMNGVCHQRYLERMKKTQPQVQFYDSEDLGSSTQD